MDKKDKKISDQNWFKATLVICLLIISVGILLTSIGSFKESDARVEEARITQKSIERDNHIIAEGIAQAIKDSANQR